jgi:large repetitive protein
MSGWRKGATRVLVVLGLLVGFLEMGREAVGIYTYLAVSVADASVVEPDTTSTAMQFVVTLSAPSRDTVTATYMTEDRTASSPDDYVAKSGTVVFHPHQTKQSVSVKVRGDRLNEGRETFVLVLLDSTNAFIGDGLGLGTIRDNDPLPGLATSNVQVEEGDSGTTPAVFVISLSAPSGRNVLVSFNTQNGSAKEPSDYFGTEGTLTFAPGVTSRSVTVLVRGDTEQERNERFFLVLSAPVNGRISDGLGVGKILNDDLQ